MLRVLKAVRRKTGIPVLDNSWTESEVREQLKQLLCVLEMVKQFLHYC